MDCKDPDIKHILDVDPDIICQFLDLIKNRYPTVDMANYYLETKLHVSGSSIAMANQRDFLSHFCTVLSNRNLDHEGRIAQLSAAEEHFRRAVIESYHNALRLKLAEVLKLYKKYMEEVIPYRKVYPDLSSAPDILTIRSSLKEIQELQIKARESKSRNQWDKDWKEGIKTYVDACDKTDDLEGILVHYISISSQFSKSQLLFSKKSILWISIGIISVIINVVLIIKMLLS
ncbi:MAG: hypothetical protein ACYC6G_19460 [Desulfobaccales bacterium]